MSPAKPIRVLLVEDDYTSAGLAAAVLQRAGMVVLPYVSNIPEAITKVFDGVCDIVILDLTLHGSHAQETLEAIPAFATQVPVIIVSGSDDAEIVASAMRLGAKDYIVKTASTVERLERAVREAHQEHTENTMTSVTAPALPFDESPPAGLPAAASHIPLFDAQGKPIRRLRPESERTAATLIVAGKKYKLSNRMLGWLKKGLPYVFAFVVGGGGVHAAKEAFAEKTPPKEQSNAGVAPILGDHDARLARIEQAFRDHVQDEKKTMESVTTTLERTNKKLDDVTDYLLKHK